MAGGAIKAGRAFVELFADDSKLVRGLKRAQARLRGFSSFANGMGKKLIAGGAALATPFLISTKIFANFSDEMLKVKAKTGAAGVEFDMLTDKAKKLGRTTSFTASQVAAGMVELGQAGFDPKQIDTMIGSMLSLARATDTELADATSIATNTMRAFKMPAEEMGRVVDTLTNLANSSNQSLVDVGESMKDLAPLAATAGDSIEDTAAALAILANNGIKGSKAGTAVARAYKNIVKAPIQRHLKAAGVAALDSAGNIRPLKDILADLGENTKDLASGAKLELFDKIFGRGMASALKLADANFEDVLGKIEGLPGSADRAAAVMDSGIGGSLRRLMSALEGVAIAIGEALAPMLSTLSKRLQGVAGWVTRLVEENGEFVKIALMVTAGVIAAGAALVMAGVAAAALNAIIGVTVAVFGAVASILGVVLGLIAALLSPIGLVAAGVVALAAYFVDWGSAVDGATTAASTAFEAFSGRALDAWAGIRDAIAAGDLALAFKIVTTALRGEWIRVVGFLQNKWGEFSAFFADAWGAAVFSAAANFANAFSGIDRIWTEITGGLSDAWSVFVGFILETWNSTIGFLKKAWENLKGLVNGDTEFGKQSSKNKAIDEETEKKNAAVRSETQKKIGESDKLRRKRLADIEEQRKSTLSGLGETEAAERQARQDKIADDLAANEAEQKAASDALAALAAKAKKKREEKNKDTGDDGFVGPQIPADELARRNRGSLRKKFGKRQAATFSAIATGKGGSEGTKTGFDRLGGFAKPGDVRATKAAAARKKMLEAMEKIAENTKKLKKVRSLPNL